MLYPHVSINQGKFMCMHFMRRPVLRGVPEVFFLPDGTLVCSLHGGSVLIPPEQSHMGASGERLSLS